MGVSVESTNVQADDRISGPLSSLGLPVHLESLESVELRKKDTKPGDPQVMRRAYHAITKNKKDSLVALSFLNVFYEYIRTGELDASVNNSANKQAFAVSQEDGCLLIPINNNTVSLTQAKKHGLEAKNLVLGNVERFLMSTVMLNIPIEKEDVLVQLKGSKKEVLLSRLSENHRPIFCNPDLAGAEIIKDTEQACNLVLMGVKGGPDAGHNGNLSTNGLDFSVLAHNLQVLKSLGLEFSVDINKCARIINDLWVQIYGYNAVDMIGTVLADVIESGLIDRKLSTKLDHNMDRAIEDIVRKSIVRMVAVVSRCRHLIPLLELCDRTLADSKDHDKSYFSAAAKDSWIDFISKGNVVAPLADLKSAVYIKEHGTYLKGRDVDATNLPKALDFKSYVRRIFKDFSTSNCSPSVYGDNYIITCLIQKINEEFKTNIKKGEKRLDVAYVLGKLGTKGLLPLDIPLKQWRVAIDYLYGEGNGRTPVMEMLWDDFFASVIEKQRSWQHTVDRCTRDVMQAVRSPDFKPKLESVTGGTDLVVAQRVPDTHALVSEHGLISDLTEPFTGIRAANEKARIDMSREQFNTQMMYLKANSDAERQDRREARSDAARMAESDRQSQRDMFHISREDNREERRFRAEQEDRSAVREDNRRREDREADLRREENNNRRDDRDRRDQRELQERRDQREAADRLSDRQERLDRAKILAESASNQALYTLIGVGTNALANLTSSVISACLDRSERKREKRQGRSHDQVSFECVKKANNTHGALEASAPDASLVTPPPYDAVFRESSGATSLDRAIDILARGQSVPADGQQGKDVMVSDQAYQLGAPPKWQAVGHPVSHPNTLPPATTPNTQPVSLPNYAHGSLPVVNSGDTVRIRPPAPPAYNPASLPHIYQGGNISIRSIADNTRPTINNPHSAAANPHLAAGLMPDRPTPSIVGLDQGSLVRTRTWFPPVVQPRPQYNAGLDQTVRAQQALPPTVVQPRPPQHGRGFYELFSRGSGGSILPPVTDSQEVARNRELLIRGRINEVIAERSALEARRSALVARNRGYATRVQPYPEGDPRRLPRILDNLRDNTRYQPYSRPSRQSTVSSGSHAEVSDSLSGRTAPRAPQNMNIDDFDNLALSNNPRGSTNPRNTDVRPAAIMTDRPDRPVSRNVERNTLFRLSDVVNRTIDRELRPIPAAQGGASNNPRNTPPPPYASVARGGAAQGGAQGGATQVDIEEPMQATSYHRLNAIPEEAEVESQVNAQNLQAVREATCCVQHLNDLRSQFEVLGQSYTQLLQEDREKGKEDEEFEQDYNEAIAYLENEYSDCSAALLALDDQINNPVVAQQLPLQEGGCFGTMIQSEVRQSDAISPPYGVRMRQVGPPYTPTATPASSDFGSKNSVFLPGTVPIQPPCDSVKLAAYTATCRAGKNESAFNVQNLQAAIHEAACHVRHIDNLRAQSEVIAQSYDPLLQQAQETDGLQNEELNKEYAEQMVCLANECSESSEALLALGDQMDAMERNVGDTKSLYPSLSDVGDAQFIQPQVAPQTEGPLFTKCMGGNPQTPPQGSLNNIRSGGSVSGSLASGGSAMPARAPSGFIDNNPYGEGPSGYRGSSASVAAGPAEGYSSGSDFSIRNQRLMPRVPSDFSCVPPSDMSSGRSHHSSGLSRSWALPASSSSLSSNPRISGSYDLAVHRHPSGSSGSYASLAQDSGLSSVSSRSGSGVSSRPGSGISSILDAISRNSGTRNNSPNNSPSGSASSLVQQQATKTNYPNLNAAPERNEIINESTNTVRVIQQLQAAIGDADARRDDLQTRVTMTKLQHEYACKVQEVQALESDLIELEDEVIAPQVAPQTEGPFCSRVADCFRGDQQHAGYNRVTPSAGLASGTTAAYGSFTPRLPSAGGGAGSGQHSPNAYLSIGAQSVPSIPAASGRAPYAGGGYQSQGGSPDLPSLNMMPQPMPGSPTLTSGRPPYAGTGVGYQGQVGGSTYRSIGAQSVPSIPAASGRAPYSGGGYQSQGGSPDLPSLNMMPQPMPGSPVATSGRALNPYNSGQGFPSIGAQSIPSIPAASGRAHYAGTGGAGPQGQGGSPNFPSFEPQPMPETWTNIHLNHAVPHPRVEALKGEDPGVQHAARMRELSAKSEQLKQQKVALQQKCDESLLEKELLVQEQEVQAMQTSIDQLNAEKSKLWEGSVSQNSQVNQVYAYQNQATYDEISNLELPNQEAGVRSPHDMSDMSFNYNNQLAPPPQTQQQAQQSKSNRQLDDAIAASVESMMVQTEALELEGVGSSRNQQQGVQNRIIGISSARQPEVLPSAYLGGPQVPSNGNLRQLLGGVVELTPNEDAWRNHDRATRRSERTSRALERTLGPQQQSRRTVPPAASLSNAYQQPRGPQAQQPAQHMQAPQHDQQQFQQRAQQMQQVPPPTLFAASQQQHYQQPSQHMQAPQHDQQQFQQAVQQMQQVPPPALSAASQQQHYQQPAQGQQQGNGWIMEQM